MSVDTQKSLRRIMKFVNMRGIIALKTVCWHFALQLWEVYSWL